MSEPATTAPESLWTISEVAEHLSVSQRTVHTLIERGLPSFKIGGSLRFRPSEVASWVDEHRRQRDA